MASTRTSSVPGFLRSGTASCFRPVSGLQFGKDFICNPLYFRLSKHMLTVLSS